MDFNVKIDSSLIEIFLETRNTIGGKLINKIISLDAAKGIYNHAAMFRNTDKNLKDFWTELIGTELKKGEKYLKDITVCLDYVNRKVSEFYEVFIEIREYMPDIVNLKTNLFLIIGYDIGVVSGGNAFLNLGHPWFCEHKRELLYFAMHELHHVVYTHFNPLFSFDELKMTSDLINAIKLSTHMEGLAVYASLERRRRENGLRHQDYVTLLDAEKVKRLTSQFFEILERYECIHNRVIETEDWDVLRLMSSGDRLWYVVGAYMAEMIDSVLGREKLNKTILDGPESFFSLYNNLTL